MDTPLHTKSIKLSAFINKLDQRVFPLQKYLGQINHRLGNSSIAIATNWKCLR